jgi:hypothetical protein
MALADGTYVFLIDSQSSVLNTTVSATVPTSGTLLGNYDAAANPTGTRTKPGLIGAFGETENVPVPVAVGVVIGGDNTTNPTGGFTLRIDLDAGEAGLSALDFDLLGGGSPAIGVTANINWNSFRTRSPTCTLLGGFTIPLPLGEATLSTLAAVQGPGEAVGPLAPAGPGVFTIAIPVTLEVTLGAAFLEQEIPPTPQSLPLVFAATVTLDGEGGAIISASLEGFELSQMEEGPIGEPFELPFTEPLCSGNLIFTLQIQNLSISSSADATIIATGVKQASQCPCDWDGSGAIGVPDIFAFLSSWFGMDPAADFDGSGELGVPDIFAFLSCWFAHPSGCV